MNNDLIFVSFEPGTRGHYIARVVASLPFVFWYKHPDNGLNPWNIHSAKNSSIRQRHAFPNHFDRITSNGRLPPTWDYVDRFFHYEDEYYEKIFWPEFNRRTETLDDTFVYCTHSSPDQLLKQFPNSKILNVVEPLETVIYKYVRTTAFFPGYVRIQEIIPEDNPWLAQLTEWKNIKKDFTFRDIWALENVGEFYNDNLKLDYENHLRNVYTPKVINRTNNFKNTLPIRMHPNWSEVRDFLLS